MARALGRDADARHFDTRASRIATAINTTFLDRMAGAYYDDKSAGYRQTSNLLPLSLGIVPAASKAAVVAHLVSDIQQRGMHLNSGALGTKVILPTLTDGRRLAVPAGRRHRTGRPGYPKVTVKPYPVGGLTSASGHVDSPLGTVSSDWTRRPGRFTLRVTVPAGATATVFVPTATRRSVTGPAGAHLETVSGGYAKFTTGSGTYVFSSLG